ncbi:MAG: MFS transporter [Magnetococcales bacterium]|nr:MFS transporter [Magnetococcales bacterium]
MIFMTLALALQPLYLRSVLGLARDNAGFVNANIQVITEVVDLLFVGYLGYLSDRFGRIPLLTGGFILSGLSALALPYSLELGAMLGVGGLTFFYVVRSAMSLGTTAVWPQVATLTGDFSDVESRPRLLARTGFMMAFGATLVYAVLMQIPRYSGLTFSMLLLAVIAFFGAWLANGFLVDVAPKYTREAVPIQTILRLLKDEKALRLSFLSAFCARNDMVIIGLFLMTWCIYFADLLGMTHAEAAAQAGMVIGFIGLVVLASIPVWGEVISRIGRVPSIVMGLLLSGCGFLSLGLIDNPLSWWVLLPAFITGLGQAGCLLAPQILTLDLAPESMRGTLLGAYNTVGCLGIIFFLLVGGFLFDWLGPAMPFVFAGVANLLVMGYGFVLMKQYADES